MLAIKLSRVGKKKRPAYRVVVTEKSRDPWGKNTEIIGFYDPLSTPKEIRFEEDRVKHWLSVGAQPTATVHNLLVNAGLVDAPKKKGHPTHKISAEELAEIEAKKKKEADAAAAKAKAAAEAEKAAKAAAEAPAPEAPSEETPAPEATAEEAAPAEEKKEEAPAEASKPAPAEEQGAEEPKAEEASEEKSE